MRLGECPELDAHEWEENGDDTYCAACGSLRRDVSTIVELRDALRALAANPHLNLGDLVYDVREREGLGWDGPSVKAWSDAVARAEKILERDAARPPAPV